MFSAVLIACFVAIASAYKAGPPVNDPGICQHMIPNHDNALPTLTNIPITLTKSQDCFNAGQSVRVTVASSGDAIEGFFMQARTGNFTNGNHSIGTFRTYTQKTGLYNCFNGQKNAVGHKDGEPKVKSLNVYWTAPSQGLTQNIQIGGTFVLHKKVFYVNQVVSFSYNANCEQKETGETTEKAQSASARVTFTMSTLVTLLFSLCLFL
jgi:hypothetical protein